MTLSLRFFLLVALLLFVDWYFFQAISTVTRNFTATKRTAIAVVYWSITAASLVLALLPLVYPFQYWAKFVRVYVVSMVLILLISKLVGILFVLLDDVLRLIEWLWRRMFSSTEALADRAAHTDTHTSGTPITRKDFLNQLALVAASVPFVSFLYGMMRGAFNYTLHTVAVKLPHLPEQFHGLKIVQISDMHIGSFTSSEPLEKAVGMILSQKPDVIFFTGDLVNNTADEAEPHLDVLKKIRAPLGVFSVIGNHDYGDYIPWDSPEAKRKNFARLQQIHAEAGWQLLMNEHRSLERDGASIAVIGIENWGAAMNFPKRGDLLKAKAGTDTHPVKLLLSHDPSHWDAQVRKDFHDIDIMFAGHTHGAQFGVEIPGFRWSPVQYFYKQWAGLYEEATASAKQYLYVNRGLGFLGYPGRVGISPEITVMELHKA